MEAAADGEIGASAFHDLVDVSGSEVGSVEVANLSVCDL